MMKNDNGVVCDYCNNNYSNEKELAAHHFFHVDQDVNTLLSSLNKLDESYKPPTALKTLPNGQLSIRILTMKNEDLAAPKPRDMSEKIEDVRLLSIIYPIQKSFLELRERLASPDDVVNDNADEDSSNGNL